MINQRSLRHLEPNAEPIKMVAAAAASVVFVGLFAMIGLAIVWTTTPF